MRSRKTAENASGDETEALLSKVARASSTTLGELSIHRSFGQQFLLNSSPLLRVF
jgi:hypothetical protein